MTSKKRVNLEAYDVSLILLLLAQSSIDERLFSMKNVFQFNSYTHINPIVQTPLLCLCTALAFGHYSVVVIWMVSDVLPFFFHFFL